MTGVIKMNRSQLQSLIDETRSNGGDTGELEGLLLEVEAEVGQTKQEQPRARRGGARTELEAEEETMEERLNNRAGHLFPGGIYGELLEKIVDIDRSYSMQDLRQLCVANGLSSGKEKKVMAAMLLARNIDLEVKEAPTIHIVLEEAGSMGNEEAEEYFLPGGTRFPVDFTETKAELDGIGWVTFLYFPSVGAGHIEALNVAEAYRSRGFGIKLMEFAIENMRGRGIKTVGLNAWTEAGAALFKKLGFTFKTARGTRMVKTL